MSRFVTSVTENRAFLSSNIPLDVLNATVGSSIPTIALSRSTEIQSGLAATQAGQAIQNADLTRQ